MIVKNAVIQRFRDFAEQHKREPQIAIMSEETLAVIGLESSEEEISKHPDGGFVFHGVRIIRSKDLFASQLILA